MPIKIGAFISKLAAKTGVDITAPEIVEFLASDIELPDAVGSLFDSARIYTHESAQNDPTLKSMFFAQALNGVDSRITGLMDEYQFPDEFRSTITSQPKTIEKVPAFIKAIKALEAQKVGATAGEKSDLQKQINLLQAEKANEIKLLNEGFAAKEAGYKSRLERGEISRIIAAKKLDTSKFGLDTMTEIAFGMLNKALAQKGVKIIEENDNFVLKRANDEALDYYENNQVVTLDNMIDQVLATNNLLAVNDQPPAPGNLPPGPRHFPNPNTPPPSGQPTGSFFTKLEQARASMAPPNG